VARFLHELVTRVQFARAASAPPVSIMVDADAEVGTARWDGDCSPGGSRRFLDNALRSADPPPPVTVTARAAAGGVELAVRDEGPGIAPEFAGSALGADGRSPPRRRAAWARHRAQAGRRATAAAWRSPRRRPARR